MKERRISLCLLLVLALSLTLCLPVSAAASRSVKLSLKLDKTDAMPGDVVTCSLEYADSTGFLGYKAVIRFDPQCLVPLGKSGEPLEPDSDVYLSKYKLYNTFCLYNKAQQVVVGGVSTTELTGSGTLAVFSMKVPDTAAKGSVDISMIVGEKDISCFPDKVTATCQGTQLSIRHTKITAGTAVRYDNLPDDSFTLETRAPGCASVMAAAYDGSGRMLAVQFAALQDDDDKAFCTLDNRNGAYKTVKLFLLGSNQIPLYAPRILTAEIK